jgi:hypothetical protein
MTPFNITESIREKSKQALRDCINLKNRAQEYNKNYSDEITEGTKKRQLLLTEGLARGLKEEDIDFGPNFIPSEKTPILNFLFFTLRDEFGGDIQVLRENFDVGKDKKELEAYYNEVISKGTLENKLDKFEDKSLPDVGKYIYGEADVDTFYKIKKLKTLASRNDDAEAFAAFKMAKKLCEKYKLDFDKIPV